MWSSTRRTPPLLFPAVAMLAGAALLVACTQAPAKKKKAPFDPGDGDDFYGADMLPYDEEPISPDGVNHDGASLGASERPAPGGDTDAGSGGDDGGVKKYCGETVSIGDLAIVEIMIS